MTGARLLMIMKRCPPDRVDLFAKCMTDAMAKADIVSVTRVAAFVGQIAVESGELRWWEELTSGQQYEGRKDLGNIEPGDGPRYKGRGPIQLTGRANYTAASKALGLDLVAHPELVATPEVGFDTSTWYWQQRGINGLVDALDYARVTKAVNGGLTNHDRRLAYYYRALEVLGRDTQAA
jgi:putative chitinase